MPRTVDRIGQAQQQLSEERNAAQREIEALQVRIGDLDAAIAQLSSLVGGPRPARRRGRPPGSGAGAGPGRPRGRRGPRGRREGTISAAIEDFLDAQGRKAIHGDEILEHLSGAGKSPTGKDPRATLQSMLHRLAKRGSVRNIGRNRWRRIRSGQNSS